MFSLQVLSISSTSQPEILAIQESTRNEEESAKYLTAINFGEIALLATYLVLLSGKVMTNPGPSHYRGDVPTFLQKPGPQNCTFKHREPPKTFRRTKDLTSGLSLPYYQPE